MGKSLQQFRDDYLEMLLRFLWREWTALGVAGHDNVALRHVVDPEALLLFTCSIGRYDPRLFDEVLDWLTRNGRFLNVQRLKNILGKEEFDGGKVVTAIAGWLSRQNDPMKWQVLAKMGGHTKETEPLFYLPDGRPLPQAPALDAVFLEQGFQRGAVRLRGYAQPFSTDATSCLALRMRALFGLNSRSDVLTYLTLNETGHPREVARELYYSQKAIHDVMTDMACSGVVLSARSARERTFRIASDALPFLTGASEATGWVNWPILLSAAEGVWRLTEALHTERLGPLVESSEITLRMNSVYARLSEARWTRRIPKRNPTQPMAQLEAFSSAFEALAA